MKSVAVVQFWPQLKQVERNRSRVTTLLRDSLASGSVDVIILPEMAFTGIYVFMYILLCT
jgi:predicted amidohydrolase